MLIKSLNELGINKGDKIYIHGNASFLHFIEGSSNEEKFRFFLDVLMNEIGPDGSLIIPSFTYSHCRNEIYDMANTPPAKELGYFADLIFRNKNLFSRTSDPIFSHFFSPSTGLDKYINTQEIYNCFGNDSFFEKMLEINSTILFIGCSFMTTFIHHIEKTANVSYRFNKRFDGEIINMDNKLIKTSSNYFVRDLSSTRSIKLHQFKLRLEKKHLLKKSHLGRINLMAINVMDLFNEGIIALKENELFFFD
jgi:aminoglycoside 3-N-acetyltransferase